MDRRNFIRTGGLALAGAVAAPTFASDLTGNKEAAPVSSAMQHFGITHADVRKTLTAALEKGGDYADLFFELCADRRTKQSKIRALLHLKLQQHTIRTSGLFQRHLIFTAYTIHAF